jgi:hypothetical protein
MLKDDCTSSTTQTPLNSTDLVVYYEALTGKLDALYSQLDQVFADAELPESKLEFFDARVVSDHEKNAKLQFRDVRVAPFDFQSVCAAAWRTVKDKAVHGIENVPGMVRLTVERIARHVQSYSLLHPICADFSERG